MEHLKPTVKQAYFYKSQKDKMVLEQIPYQFENGKMYTALDERIREGLMEEAERFSVPDDLKDKITVDE